MTFSRQLRGKVLDALPRWLLIRRGPAGVPKVALTFDDGPDWLTERYLDLLDELRAPASFFLVGRQVEAQPHLTREYVRRGHEIYGHGYAHLRLPSLSPEELARELRRTTAILPPHEGRFALVRPPFGAFDLPTLWRCAALGHTLVMWSHDSLDYKIRDGAQLAAHVQKLPLSGGEILLLHEGQTWTLAALRQIVADLRARGLEPVTLSALLGGA